MNLKLKQEYMFKRQDKWLITIHVIINGIGYATDVCFSNIGRVDMGGR